MTALLGIDPGRTGAIARLYKGDAGMWRVDTHDLPQTPGALAELIGKLTPVVLAAVERPFYPPHIGIRSATTIAHAYGALTATLTHCGVPFCEVAPRDWKRSLRVPADKAGARRRAEEFFPDDAGQWRLAKHHGRAEAALIAWYGRRWADA